MSYAAAYPNAIREIVQQQQTPVGQLYTSCHGNQWLLIDISLLPEYRNQGIGSSLLQKLQKNAHRAEAAIQLSVLPMSSAARLYHRLGFRHVSSSGLHHILEWSHLHNDND
ncbi:Acetyltransferase (GNAT) family protein [compost metagenome]